MACLTTVVADKILKFEIQRRPRSYCLLHPSNFRNLTSFLTISTLRFLILLLALISHTLLLLLTATRNCIATRLTSR